MDSGPLAPANNSIVREFQPAQAFDLGRPAGPQIYPQLPSHESVIDEYLLVLRKRWGSVLACLGIIVTLVAIASLRMPKVYEAGGTIAINKPDNSLNFQNNATFSLDYYDPSELETEVKILQSDVLALEVIRKLNLDRRPEFGGATSSPSLDLEPDPGDNPARVSSLIDGFKGGLRVVLSPNSRIIEVHYRSTDPQAAANVVNSLLQTDIEDNLKNRFESTMAASAWLKNQLVDMQMNVETSQEKLVRYQKEHEILGMDEKQNITTQKLDELNKALTAAESERMDKESFYHLVESGDPDAIASSAGGLGAGSGVQSDSALLDSLRNKQGDLKIQAADLNTQFGPSYPKVTQLNNQLKEIDAQIQGEMKKIASTVRGQYITALGRENMLHDALEKQKQEANKLNESAIEYNMLKRDADTYRALYEGILEKLKQAEVSSGLKATNFRIVDAARTPSYPIEPNIPRNLGFAFVLGLASGVGLAFLREGLDNKIRTTEQAHMFSGLPSLGMIPLPSKYAREETNSKGLAIASSKKAVELVTYDEPRSQMAESYRALRTTLLLSGVGSPPQVIMVTSALPKEGKTTTSINCAIALAQKKGGGRVLLIDADLRLPSIHKALGMGQPGTTEERLRGLSDVLTGNAELEQAILRATILPKLPNLFILPAGTPPLYPAELLASPKMGEVLAQLREEYEHIVVDTPPSLIATDAVVLSARVDAVVLVIRSEKTKKQDLRRARDLLAQVRAKVVGVLLNAVDLSSPGYSYYSEYQGKYAQYYRSGEGSGDGDESDDDVEETSAPSSSSA